MFPIEKTIILETRNAGRSGSEALISVAVSLFNYDKYLPECLGSVVEQTHQRLELVIVDDGSSDASIEVARSWIEDHQSRFERCLLVQHTQNQGLSQTRNTAFELARADYVFVLDADNMIYPRALERLLECIQTTGAGVAYSQLEIFGDQTASQLDNFGGQKRLGLADVWDPASFKKLNYVDAMSLISKDAWRRVGGYTNMNYGLEDYELWCKFIEHNIDGIFIPEILCRYRLHNSSMTAAMLTDRNIRLIRSINEITALHPWLDIPIPS